MRRETNKETSVVGLLLKVTDMEPALAKVVRECAIGFEGLSKSTKVRLLSHFNTEFAPLAANARKGVRHPFVLTDTAADHMLREQPIQSYYLIPDDESGQPSLFCKANRFPELGELLSDTLTKCDEIIILDADFCWSFVLVNHGTSGVGRYFMQA